MSFSAQKVKKSATKKDNIVYSSNGRSAVDCLENISKEQTHLTHNSPCPYTALRTAGQMGNDNSLQKNRVSARYSGKLGRRGKVKSVIKRSEKYQESKANLLSYLSIMDEL